MTRKLTIPIVLALAGSVLILAAGPGANAATRLIAAISDDPQNDKAPYTAALAGVVPPIPTLPVVGDPLSADDIGKTPAQLGGCDTIDPYLTVNRDNVSYRCIKPFNIKSARLETTGHSFIATWTVDDALRTPGILDVSAGPGAGMLLDVRFRSPWMNARRIAGDTLDCKRFAHAGPYLMGKKNLSTGQVTAGNNDWMSVWLEILTDDGLHWHAQHGWSHNDPASLGDYLNVADPPRPKTDPDPPQGCDSAGNIVSVDFPGTAGTPVDNVCFSEVPSCTAETTLLSSKPVYSTDRKTVSIEVPFNFGYVDNQLHVYNVPWMTAGQVIWDISATATSIFNCASTPQENAGDMQLIGAQGVQCGSQLDWAPWQSFDLGKYVDQTSFAQSVPEATYGPTCPYFQVLEYTPGQARQDKAPYYGNLGNAPGQDNDVMLNPLYTDKGNSVSPLTNYDAGWAAGTSAPTTNTLVKPAQGRNGNTFCNVPVPDAMRQASSNFQGTS